MHGATVFPQYETYFLQLHTVFSVFKIIHGCTLLKGCLFWVFIFYLLIFFFTSYRENIVSCFFMLFIVFQSVGLFIFVICCKRQRGRQANLNISQNIKAFSFLFSERNCQYQFKRASRFKIRWHMNNKQFQPSKKCLSFCGTLSVPSSCLASVINRRNLPLLVTLEETDLQ